MHKHDVTSNADGPSLGPDPGPDPVTTIEKDPVLNKEQSKEADKAASA